MSDNKPILTAGNDFYLRVNVYTVNAQGEREPFNLSACDKWAFYLKSSYCTITKTTYGLEEGSLNTILVDCKDIKRGMGYTAEVVAVLNGRNVRCAERGVFGITDYNADANVTFAVYEAEKGQDLDMEFQIVSSAEIVGKNAYELAVEQGYEGTLGDWLADIVHDADYVHTDNNFTDEYKEKVDDVANIPEWALQPTKPTYTAQEVGAPSTQEFETAVQDLEREKQDTLVFDDTPTAGSPNPVSSAGVKAYVDNAVNAGTPQQVHTKVAATLSPEIVHVFAGTTDTLAITLTAPTDALSHLYTLILATGTTPAVTIQVSDSTAIIYPDDYAIEAGTTYEISVLYANGKYYLRYVTYQEA